MNRNYVVKECCKEILPDLSVQLIEKVLLANPNKSTDEIIEILLLEDENSKSFEMNNQERLSGDLIFTKPCKKRSCNDPNCTYYHSEKEKRRPQSVYQYSKTPCRHSFDNEKRTWLNNSRCRFDDNCGFAHNENEVKHYINLNHNQRPRGESPYKSKQEITKNNGKEIEKIEFIKFEQSPANDISFLTETTQSLKYEVCDKIKQIESKYSQLNNINQEIMAFSNVLVCGACRKNELEYVLNPCGHSVCRPCISSHSCPCCNFAISEYIKSNL